LIPIRCYRRLQVACDRASIEVYLDDVTLDAADSKVWHWSVQEYLFLLFPIL
jgi:inorganic triphosphatase YgiF